MTPATPSCQIFSFPEARRWPCIARKYVDYTLMGDPRAANFYLEYELALLNLSRMPAELKREIEKECNRRGFAGPIRFR